MGAGASSAVAALCAASPTEVQEFAGQLRADLPLSS